MCLSFCAACGSRRRQHRREDRGLATRETGSARVGRDSGLCGLCVRFVPYQVGAVLGTLNCRIADTRGRALSRSAFSVSAGKFACTIRRSLRLAPSPRVPAEQARSLFTGRATGSARARTGESGYGSVRGVWRGACVARGVCLLACLCLRGVALRGACVLVSACAEGVQSNPR